MLGKLIAMALQDKDSEDTFQGPELPLNEAARAAHLRHVAIVDELWEPMQQARLELKKLENKMEEEQVRWGIEMRAIQPELKGMAAFQINDANTHFRVIRDRNNDRPDKVISMPVQPDWAKDIIKADKPN